jgi:Fic family protein
VFFLRCLGEQVKVLERKVEREQIMAALSALDEALLRLAKERGRLTVASAVKLTKANRNTVKLHLRQLTEAGRLHLRGAGRGAWYEVA